MGIGFFKTTRARNAEEAIGQSEGLVTVLRLTQVDMKPAEDALQIAKQFFTGHRYSKAFQAARKAESLAITLDERYNGYQKAARTLTSRVASMARLGLPTESLAKAVGRAEETILAGIWENGSFVPNYLQAQALVEQSEREGRVVQEKAQRASDLVFMAELAIESVAELKGPFDSVVFSQSATSGLEQALHEATRELALGNADGAAAITKDIAERAARMKKQYAASIKVLGATETHLADLRGEGILTQSFEGQAKMARDMLARGQIEAAHTMATRLIREAKALGDVFRKATTTLGDAEILYARLQREGFHSYEADAAIRDARRTIREGSYARSIEHLERALQAFARRTNARAALSRAIDETRTRVKLLQGRGLAFLPDIQEVLGRAEREFQKGNLSASSEDLRIAAVLLDQVTRARRPAAASAPSPPKP
ncbi:MAG: hypothetical protein L3J78_01110 [Thermoplasmata archaeon]|nr:hypothetical protein [Thermoplasmata archaeon]